MEPYQASALLAERLRCALASPTFLGVEIGETLDDWIEAVLQRPERRLGARRILRAHAMLRFHSWRGAEHRDATGAGLPPGRLLLALVSTREYLRDMVVPLVERLGPEQCNVLGDEAPGFRDLPPGARFARWRNVQPCALGAWRSEYRRCAPAWAAAVRRECAALGMPRALPAMLDHALLVNSQRIARYTTLLERLRPAAVVTDFDRHMRVSCLILATRAAGIPSATLQRGVINGAFTFAPLLADHALVWGEMHRQRYLQYQTPAERVHVVGSSRLHRGLSATRSAALARLGLRLDRPVVLLGTSPMIDSYRETLVAGFCQAFSTGEVTAIVRLHPSERLDGYSGLRQRFPSVTFSAASDWTLDEALAAADIVVVHASGLGSDALIKRRLAVVLDVLPLALGHSEDLVVRAGVPRATGSDELRAVVLGLLADPERRRRLEAERERYVPEFCAAFGADAAGRTAAAIRSHVLGAVPITES